MLPGNHGALAERFRDRALHKIALARILVEMLDQSLREHPDDDARFDEAAEQIYPLFARIGEDIHYFRETREATEN
jgi:hypothetical protein